MTNELPATALAANLVAGLRDLADFIERNPDLAEGFRYDLTSSGINAHLNHLDDKVAGQAQFAKAAARYGAKVTKDVNDTFHNVTLTFAGGVKVDVLAYRNEVCERVVTSTETVTKTVPDPEALAAVPTVEVTEQVEHFEWVCKPVLAAAVERVSS